MPPKHCKIGPCIKHRRGNRVDCHVKLKENESVPLADRDHIIMLLIIDCTLRQLNVYCSDSNVTIYYISGHSFLLLFVWRIFKMDHSHLHDNID